MSFTCLTWLGGAAIVHKWPAKETAGAPPAHHIIARGALSRGWPDGGAWAPRPPTSAPTQNHVLEILLVALKLEENPDCLALEPFVQVLQRHAPSAVAIVVQPILGLGRGA